MAHKIEIEAPIKVIIWDFFLPYFNRTTQPIKVGNSTKPAMALLTKKLPEKRTRPGADWSLNAIIIPIKVRYSFLYN